jgi:hypothetical protein
MGFENAVLYLLFNKMTEWQGVQSAAGTFGEDVDCDVEKIH